ncbi:B3 domain-containing protein [Cucumis melo var. makuwa]|nr:B3 domain-containing protein [Cucumis melo var. makuwa]TYK11542.1 B3 domain-containing protein [Cucumis melo var. makuwa]
MNSVLPGIMIPTAIYCGEKVWKMNYYGNRRSKALESKQWKKFVNDNGLKCGDGCVFELLECTASLLKFRVQILRGHIPFQLHHKFTGETKDTPIVID